MEYIEALKKLWKDLNINLPEVTVLIVSVTILGIILLSFTFILPVLLISAAFLIIAGAIYFIYKLLGGS